MHSHHSWFWTSPPRLSSSWLIHCKSKHTNVRVHSNQFTQTHTQNWPCSHTITHIRTRAHTANPHTTPHTTHANTQSYVFLQYTDTYLTSLCRWSLRFASPAQVDWGEAWHCVHGKCGASMWNSHYTCGAHAASLHTGTLKSQNCALQHQHTSHTYTSYIHTLVFHCCWARQLVGGVSLGQQLADCACVSVYVYCLFGEGRREKGNRP